MLEWGPGGGCNAIHFTRHAQQIFGVDVSAANLRQCQAQLRANGFKDFTSIEIDAEKPDAVLDKVDRPVDFFLCTAVFQHFPSQAYGRRVVEIAHQMLADDGIALIQTRYDDGSETVKCKSDDYQRNVSTFTSYRVEEFWEIAVGAGFKPLNVSLALSTKYAFYTLQKGPRS
jgi:cyclopropane fatty-acyl-phospholipid synthase-like methyltransferase